MAIETGLEGKPWYVVALIALVLAGAIAGGAYYFKVRHMQDEYAGKEVRLTGLQQKIREGRAAQARLPQFEEEIARLELDLEKLLRILPARRNTEGLLSQIRTLVEQGDFQLLRFSPQSLRPLDFYSEWPIKMELEGTYHALALFFDRIGRFSRIINVNDLNIQGLRSGDASHHTIKASFTAKTFLYNETEAELEPLQ